MMKNLNYKNAKLSDHAFKRIQERYPKYANTKNSALNWVLSMLDQSDYIGMITSIEDGSDVHMYVFNKKTSIYLSPNFNTVITLFELDERPLDKIPFRDEIENRYRTKLRVIHRSEVKLRRKVEDLTLKYEMEIGILKYKKYKARTDKVKKECDAKILELQKTIEEETRKLIGIRKDIKDIAYAIAVKKF